MEEIYILSQTGVIRHIQYAYAMFGRLSQNNSDLRIKLMGSPVIVTMNQTKHDAAVHVEGRWVYLGDKVHELGILGGHNVTQHDESGSPLVTEVSRTVHFKPNFGHIFNNKTEMMLAMLKREV